MPAGRRVTITACQSPSVSDHSRMAGAPNFTPAVLGNPGTSAHRLVRVGDLHD